VAGQRLKTDKAAAVMTTTTKAAAKPIPPKRGTEPRGYGETGLDSWFGQRREPPSAG